MQKTALPFAACLLAFAVAGAHAQTLWKWRDASGQMHISDTAPPPGTPAKNIISGPPGGVAVPSSLAAAPSASAPANPAAASAPSALEKKKAAADQAKADKEKADHAAADAQNAAIRKDNCARAQDALATLQSGQRVATVDSKGERQYMDDDARAGEIKRAQQSVTGNCGAAPAAQ
jgi:hypothetical protein